MPIYDPRLPKSLGGKTFEEMALNVDIALIILKLARAFEEDPNEVHNLALKKNIKVKLHFTLKSVILLQQCSIAKSCFSQLKSDFLRFIIGSSLFKSVADASLNASRINPFSIFQNVVKRLHSCPPR
jgi:hypothetical protein